MDSSVVVASVGRARARPAPRGTVLVAFFAKVIRPCGASVVVVAVAIVTCLMDSYVVVAVVGRGGPASLHGVRGYCYYI